MSVAQDALNFIRSFGKKSADVVKDVTTNSSINKEIRHQKDLGTFLPDEAYQGDLIRPRHTQGPLDEKGSFMDDSAWNRLHKSLEEKDSNLDIQKNIREGREKQNRTKKRIDSRKTLRGVKTSDGVLSPLASTLKTGYHSASNFLKQDDNLKRAGMGVVQSGATGAFVSGGLAALQGDDPWEAAKSGAVKGAFGGIGYQGLKAATHANTGSIRGNIKHIASTTKQTYQAHTRGGNVAMQRSGVSKQLQTVLNASELNKMNIASNKLYNKG